MGVKTLKNKLGCYIKVMCFVIFIVQALFMQPYNTLSSVFCLPHFGAVFLISDAKRGKSLKRFFRS